VAGLFSESTLEQIRGASDIVDVIGSYLPLKRAGANFVALCPFHKEKSPSFNVNPSRQIFHCFGCHKGGDVFTFVKEYENLSFVEAVKRLADRASIPLEMEQGGAAAEARSTKELLLRIHEEITQRWQAALATDASGQTARDYLAKRGVSAEAAKLFRLGYAPELWDDTVNWAKTKGYEIADAEKAGLIIHKEGTDRYYDRFRGRLMFPICDEQGRVVGFSGRILSGDEKTAKYVNSPETAIFSKSRLFFGLDKTKRAILEAGSAIICEGQLDLIACYTAGVKNIVAPQGTSFTAEHARIIKRYVNEVVLCFDSDAAGQNAAVRSLDSLLASGLAVRVAVVPPPHDPDSFIKENGGEAFGSLVKEARGFFDFYLDRLCGQIATGTDRSRQEVVRGMAEALHKTGNAVTIDAFAQKTALRLGVNPDAVRSEFKKFRATEAIGGSRTDAAEPEQDESFETSTPPQPSSHESWLLKLLLLNDALVPWAADHLATEWLDHPAVRAIVEWRFAAETGGRWHGVAAMLDAFESGQSRRLITEAASTDRPIPNAATQLADLATRLRNRHIDAHRATLLPKLSDPGLTDDSRAALLREDHDLRLLKQAPIQPAA
jgi:DNA primase